MGLIRFFLPAFAIVGSFYFVAFTEEDRKWKLLIFLLTGTSLVLQFLFPDVPFVIPMILQAVVMLWTIIYWKLDQ
jgi:hypothetical protein